jgi:hypothetical protein
VSNRALFRGVSIVVYWGPLSFKHNHIRNGNEESMKTHNCSCPALELMKSQEEMISQICLDEAMFTSTLSSICQTPPPCLQQTYLVVHSLISWENLLRIWDLGGAGEIVQNEIAIHLPLNLHLISSSSSSQSHYWTCCYHLFQ